jgi:hypothetical protein
MNVVAAASPPKIEYFISRRMIIEDLKAYTGQERDAIEDCLHLIETDPYIEGSKRTKLIGTEIWEYCTTTYMIKIVYIVHEKDGKIAIINISRF